MNKVPGVNLEFVREDDFVEYYIFPQLSAVDGAAEDVLEEQVCQQLSEVQAECMAIVQQKVTERSYIWHKDEFQLQARTGSAKERILNDETNDDDDGEALPPHLHGITHYGDNIGDEWFIVYLLCELTRLRSDFIARICDADGEFLLIEAADVLPDWASPETCEQRVYLVNGELQLVQNSPSTTKGKRMPMATAVQRICLNPTLYRCSKAMQGCIEARIREFVPAQPHLATHRQIVELPQNAAVLLKQRPALIASAVRAFCERDTMDAKALRVMRYFPPESTRVRTNVTFTRCLYAMLMHSQYTPERKVGWQLTNAGNAERYKEQLLGVKIASGLEILASQAKREGEKVEETPAWRAYLRSLQSKGYFRDNIEGSAEYGSLLATALEYFKSNQARFRTAPRVGAEILELLRTSDSEKVEQLRDEENNLQPSDKDDWLSISAEDLDAMLQERYGPKKLYKPNGDMNAAEFTKQLSEFLEQQSNFEGIEPPTDGADMLDSDDDEPTPATGASSHKSPAERKREFGAKVKKNNSMRKACQRNSLLKEDDEQDSTHVRNFLDFVIPEDNWDSTSEMSDYADEEDLERNFDAALAGSSSAFGLDHNIKAYMEQMDRELAQTTVGKSFHGKSNSRTSNRTGNDDDDDFDDIEDFEPININVNTLKNMMDSYKSQVGGAGPVSNLLNAMGAGMSVAAAAESDKPKDLSESAV
ncbi:protein ecdysoneless isoform X2 [Scaptodrosophila lebanonensis]|uniref:Protein ecdysoneless isoform X2 n=1 Tax=Drosophila lebanonensis TaxID=7225 RepID=A0A6J2TAG5_DROLE|nr:protein ecdysoneless isoform X2 [Scaptodrosophila lebanonensis]